MYSFSSVKDSKADASLCQSTSVLILEDNPFTALGMQATLINHQFSQLNIASRLDQFLLHLRAKKPCVVMINLTFPKLSLPQLMKEIRVHHAQARVVLLQFGEQSHFPDLDTLPEVQGVLSKTNFTRDLVQCLHRVIQGYRYIEQSYVRKKSLGLKELSGKELKVLQCIARQMSNRFIADELFISVRTVEKHRSNIIRKLNLSQEVNCLSKWAVANSDPILGYVELMSA